MSRNMFAGFFVTVVALLAVATPAEATFPGGNGLIAVASQRDGNAEIYTMTPSGLTQTRLTDNAAADYDPAFSPDGGQIAFVSDRDGDAEIYVMNADGSEQTRVTDRVGDDMDPAFSPDGSRLVIRRSVGGNNEIVAIDSDDGGNAVNLTDHAASDFEPEFSPDGTKIVYQRFTSGTGSGFGNEVFLMNADGSDQVNLTSNLNSVNDGRPSFSPDGTRIAFDSNRYDSHFEIHTMNLTGGDITRITDIAAGVSQEPAYSPDGTLVAFRAAGTGGTGIARIASGGGTESAISTGTGDSNPAWAADDDAPVTQITGGPAEGSSTADPEPEFSFGSSEVESTFECRVDTAEWDVCASPATVATLDDGEHTFAVRATDGAGNTDQAPASRTFTVDTVAPQATIESGPAALTDDAGADFEFTAGETGATTECRIDSVSDTDWASCESPRAFTGLADGAHVFEVRSTDLAGNTGDPATHTWTVDTTAPVVTIDSAPASPSGSIHASFAFTADEPFDLAECRLDPGVETEWSPCESPAGYTGLGEGAHRFEVRVTDAAGHLSEPAVHEWTVETVKPGVTITSAPDTPNGETSASFEFNSENAAATFECRLDPGAESEWEGCTSPAGYTGLSEGEHTFEVRAVDAEAGPGQPATHSWTIDTIVPTVEITGAPAPISGNTGPTFGFAADEPGTSAECRLDPADEEAGWTPCESPVTYTGLAEGPHRFDVRVTDPVGLVSETVTYEWTVETTPPTATITSGPSGVTAEISAWFGFTSDNPAAGFECRLDPSGPGGWDPCVSGVEYDNLADGEHHFEVRSVGQGAGPGPVVSRNWTIDTVAPAVAITSGPAQPTNERDATFVIEMNKPGFTLECRIDAEPAGPCSSPVTYPGLEPGEHSFVVEASGAGGEVVDSAVWQWTILADRPVAAISDGPPEVSSSATAVFSFGSDVPEATFECRTDGGAWAACTSPAGFAGLGDGDHTFEVRAGLPGGAAGDPVSHEWTVDTAAPVVSLNGGPVGPTASATATFDVGSDDANATTECSLDGGTWSPCIGETAFTGLADGDHTLRVRAVDGVGNTGLARRDWSVDTTPPATEILGKPKAETTDFDARFTFKAGEAASTFECRLDGGEWKPCSSAHRVRALDRGAHSFAVRATDPLGNTGQPASHEWRIVAPAPKSLVPAVALQRKIRLDADGTAKLATVRCPEGSCRVLAPKKVNFRLRGRKFTPGIKSPRGWYSERSVEVMLITSAGTRRIVRKHGPARIRVKLTVESDNGKRRTVKSMILLVAGR